MQCLPFARAHKNQIKVNKCRCFFRCIIFILPNNFTALKHIFHIFNIRIENTNSIYFNRNCISFHLFLYFFLSLFRLVDFFIYAIWTTANGAQTRENNKHNELLERIHQLECKEAIILKESHELREQNELLEFRIIELEEGADKVKH